jgi:hypothetical protein
MTVAALNETELETLGRLADALIPPAAGRRSATQAGVNGALLARATAYVSDLPERLRAVTALAAGRAAPDVLRELKQSSPATYDVFCETIAAIYFMSPEVRSSIGFPGREAVPARTDVADLEDLLMPVLEAGFGPRETEGDGREA